MKKPTSLLCRIICDKINEFIKEAEKLCRVRVINYNSSDKVMLNAGEWKIFGAHGYVKDYSVK